MSHVTHLSLRSRHLSRTLKIMLVVLVIGLPFMANAYAADSRGSGSATTAPSDSVVVNVGSPGASGLAFGQNSRAVDHGDTTYTITYGLKVANQGSQSLPYWIDISQQFGNGIEINSSSIQSVGNTPAVTSGFNLAPAQYTTAKNVHVIGVAHQDAVDYTPTSSAPAGTLFLAPGASHEYRITVNATVPASVPNYLRDCTAPSADKNDPRYASRQSGHATNPDENSTGFMLNPTLLTWNPNYVNGVSAYASEAQFQGSCSQATLLAVPVQTTQNTTATSAPVDQKKSEVPSSGHAPQPKAGSTPPADAPPAQSPQPTFTKMQDPSQIGGQIPAKSGTNIHIKENMPLTNSQLNDVSETDPVALSTGDELPQEISVEENTTLLSSTQAHTSDHVSHSGVTPVGNDITDPSPKSDSINSSYSEQSLVASTSSAPSSSSHDTSQYIWAAWGVCVLGAAALLARETHKYTKKRGSLTPVKMQAVATTAVNQTPRAGLYNNNVDYMSLVSPSQSDSTVHSDPTIDLPRTQSIAQSSEHARPRLGMDILAKIKNVFTHNREKEVVYAKK